MASLPYPAWLCLSAIEMRLAPAAEAGGPVAGHEHGSHALPDVASSGSAAEDSSAAHEWTVYKRFSDFIKLRKSMVEAARADAVGRDGMPRGVAGGGGAAGASIPVLPPKRWRSMSRQVVQERMTGLLDFLWQALLSRDAHPPAVAHVLARFLMAQP